MIIHFHHPMTSNHPLNLRFKKMPLNFGSGVIPALGFGTLIPDPTETKIAVANALRVGFRHFDCAERYRNERDVGESLQVEFANGAIAREDVFITTKLWNTNYNLSEIPEVAVDEINRIQIRSRLNSVVETGVPGFIAKAG